MINELDETIKEILIAEGGLDPTEVEISFDIPNREWSGGISKPTINCYLFDIRENRELRQSGMQTDKGAPNGASRRRPPMRVDLTYLLTAWTREVEDEHRLLWHVLRTLMRFGTLPPAHFQGALQEHELPIYTRIAMSDGVLKSPGEFWTALENHLKPSLSYVATLALAHDAVLAGPPVLTASTRLRSLQFDRVGNSELRIGGVLRNETGAPVAGAELRIEGYAGRTSSDAAGRYTLRVPRPDDYTLVVRASETIYRRELAVPASNYDVTLETPEPPAAPRRQRR